MAYATMAGSTAEVAQAIGEQLTAGGFRVDVQPLAEAGDPDGYDAVVLGAPMIMGWHRAALRYLRRQRKTLRRKPLAIFVLCMSLTETGDRPAPEVPVTVDPELAKPPLVPGKLSFRERYTSLSSYLRQILRAAGRSRLVGIGVFGGRLELGRLSWWAVLFATLIVRAAPGDLRDWEAIRSWVAGLPEALGLPSPGPID